MESPSPTVRRRAWINSRRQWLTLEELDSEGLLCSLPSASTVDDDVFSDGCFTGKIENWLLGCGSEASTEKPAQLSFECGLKVNHFDDELSLGADASALNVGEITSEASPSPRQGRSRLTSSTPRQALCLPSVNLGHSMASSCLSSSTTYTTSSVSEVLQLCSEDAEETLYELGFGCDEPQVTVRIPPRFFNFPSLAEGINFRLFLDSQLRRIRDEDPSLSLASRFRQVQVLTAMANAFYSLYSHVSRTPLQKLATPEFAFSSSPVERIERFRSSIRSEPRSPVERLKDTVSKMCLYTGSPRGSDSTSPQPSPKKRSSLPEVVDIVLDKVKIVVTKKLDLESNSTVDLNLVRDGDKSCESRKEVQAEQTAADSDTLHSGNTIGHKKMECMQCDMKTAHPMPASSLTSDSICPRIVESVHQEPLCMCSEELQHMARSCPPSHTQSAVVSKPDKDLHMAEPLPVLASSGSFTQCCINETVPPVQPVCDTTDSTFLLPPVKTSEQSFVEGKSQYLNPLIHQSRGTAKLQQAHSFELEEVCSAGEEDFGRSKTARPASLLTKICQYKGEVAQDDSIQSDSSGYADEEVSPSHR